MRSDHFKNNFLEALFSDRIVMLIITINSFVLFLGAFPDCKLECHPHLFWTDYLCTVYFILEVIAKVKRDGWQKYWASGWNKFDFIIVLVSSPLLLSPFLNTRDFGVILIMRIGRLFRFFKIARFIPDQDHLWSGIKRALAASIGFIVTLVIYNFILAIGASYLFASADPEHFGDPIISIYSMFKVFTVEGWYEIPDTIAENASPFMGFVARAYFVFTVLTGGLIGLSLANAVFVDEMVMDNTNTLERKIDSIRDELKEELSLANIKNKEELETLYTKLQELINSKSQE